MLFPSFDIPYGIRCPLHRTAVSSSRFFVAMTFLLGVYTVTAAIPLIFFGFAGCVMFSEEPVGDGYNDGGNDDDKTLTVSSMVKSCLAGADPFLPCINERAMAAIEQTESMDAVRLDSGLEIFRQPGSEAFAPRGVYTFGKPRRAIRAFLHHPYHQRTLR